MKPNQRALLNSFTDYCNKHQNERFWQALSNWTGKYILQAESLNGNTNEFGGIQDTYYLEEKTTPMPTKDNQCELLKKYGKRCVGIICEIHGCECPCHISPKGESVTRGTLVGFRIHQEVCAICGKEAERGKDHGCAGYPKREKEWEVKLIEMYDEINNFKEGTPSSKDFINLVQSEKDKSFKEGMKKGSGITNAIRNLKESIDNQNPND